MDIRRLDLDVAIYRDRVQVTDRATDTFIDCRAEFPFSSDRSLIEHPRYLEDTLVRAIRQLLKAGTGFSLRSPIAHVVASEWPLSPTQRMQVETALIEAGMREVVFEL